MNKAKLSVMIFFFSFVSLLFFLLFDTNNGKLMLPRYDR